MGHFTAVITATGEDQREAEGAAIAQFYRENGTQCNLQELKDAVLLRKVPPTKQVEERQTRRGLYGPQTVTIVRTVEDTGAPPSEWLEEWQFTWDYHS